MLSLRVLVAPLVLVAAACSAGVGGAWPGEPGGEVLGEVEGGAICETAADCPWVECHAAAVCMGGVCVHPALPARQPCSTGICSDEGKCEPCADDAECQSVNINDCHDLACSPERTCMPVQKADGAACNFTAGHCIISAACIPDQTAE